MSENGKDTAWFEYLGKGPGVTGPGEGWTMNSSLYLKCTQCGTMMCADPGTDGQCKCGALTKDAAHGRVGSRHGDRAIEVYQKRSGGA